MAETLMAILKVRLHKTRKKRQILPPHIFTFQMTGRQQPDMNNCLAKIRPVVSKIFLTIEMKMTGAGKMRQLFSFLTHSLS